MVRVPISTESARPTQALGNERLRYSGARDMVGPAVQQLAQTGQRVAQVLDQIEATYDEADTLDADNKGAAEISAMMSDFKQLRGNVPAGELEDRKRKLEQTVQSLASTRRSKRSQEMTRRTLNQRLLMAEAGMRDHADKEMFGFRDGALAAGAAQAQRDAIDAFGTEDFDTFMGVAMTRLEERARHNGWSEQELADQKAASTAAIWGNIILAQEADGNPADALETLDRVKGVIPSDMETRLRKTLTPRVEAREAREAFPAVLEQYLAEVGPVEAPTASSAPVAGKTPNAPSLDGITAQSESGNRDFDSRGRPITSPVGARFAMQVMPATARDPGFGLRPADPNNAADMNRLGREYRAVMEDRYGGDLAKMWAAYNAGPGRVDDAVREHGSNWLSHMPAETRAYVSKNMAKVRGAGPQTTGTGDIASDARLDPRVAEAAARWWAAKNDFSEDKAEAYVSAAGDFVSRERGIIQQREQDADKRLLDWMSDNKPGGELTSLNEIPAALMDSISSSLRERLYDRVEATRQRALDREQADATALDTALRDNAILSLYRMGPEELARTDLREFEGVIPASTLGPWYAKQRAAAGGGAKGLSPDRLASMLDSLGGILGPRGAKTRATPISRQRRSSANCGLT